MILFAKSDSSIGFVARRETKGPEARMLHAFLRAYLAKEVNRPCGGSIAVFNEPMLPTGFPDRVIVRYDETRYAHWEESRKKLTSVDLRILHHLTVCGPAPSEALRTMLGFDWRRLIQSLEHLNASGLVDLVAGAWKARTVSSVFGIREITSIEAKMSDWTGALQQASLNQTFATKSYVLTPCFAPPPGARSFADDRGIGIFAFSPAAGMRRVKAAQTFFKPVSYAPWLFNEWIGRRLAKRRRSA